MTGSEAALVAAVAQIGRLPGAVVRSEPDATVVASGHGLSSLNHVVAIRFGGTDADIDDRIVAIERQLLSTGSSPATWWVTPSTLPVDLGRRLEDRGFEPTELEYGMVIDIRADLFGAPMAGDVETVDAVDLDDWLAVMAQAYAWSDPRSASAWGSLYRAPIHGDDERPWWHVLVREGGRAVACASLSTAGGHAFVTNVGTDPSARGRGFGTTATLATLGIARDLGYRQASLAASEMGRSIYARIGFREDARFARWISGPSA